MSKANTKTSGKKKESASLFRNDKPLSPPLKKGKTLGKGKTKDFGAVMDSLSNYRFL